MKKIKSFISCLLLMLTLVLVGCGSTRINIDMSGLTSYAVQAEVIKMQSHLLPKIILVRL